MITLIDACEIIKIAEDNNLKLYIDGGWGVDALLGEVTRSHNDIDLFLKKVEYHKFIDLIRDKGFSEKVMEYTTNDHTVWVDKAGRIIDLHCFEIINDVLIRYDGEVYPLKIFSGVGKIGNYDVACIEPVSQVVFHLGYEFEENDRHDVLLICKKFGIPIPEQYK